MSPERVCANSLTTWSCGRSRQPRHISALLPTLDIPTQLVPHDLGRREGVPESSAEPSRCPVRRTWDSNARRLRSRFCPGRCARGRNHCGRRAKKTNSRPGRSGASRLSSMIPGEIIEYLDTGKVLAKDVEGEDIVFARPGPTVEYWEGEE